MYLIIALIIILVIVALLSKLYVMNKDRIRFFLEGMNRSFSIGELNVLWQAQALCDLEEPAAIFISMNALSTCIAKVKAVAESQGNVNSAKMQNLLSKLYSFRTKIEKDEDKKRGLESTRSLVKGQKLRIILPGQGVFSSEIVNNGRDITILVPTQKGQITVEGPKWVGQTVNVYLWRTGDARYVFDTSVQGEGIFLGRPCLHLLHTVNLTRTQKRNAVRAKCHVQAQLYIIKEQEIDYNRVETKPGFKCIIEDVSEKGALVRIGGKGIPKIQIRLQFQLSDRLVIMYGIVRTVEYNEELKQSRLHFECIHIDEAMKNNVLSYVYNILPQNEKEIYDALSFTDQDEKEDQEKTQSAAPETDEKENGSDSFKTTDELTSVKKDDNSDSSYSEENTINTDNLAEITLENNDILSDELETFRNE